MKRIPLSFVILAAAAIGGCTSGFPRVDAAMGKSVTQMIRAETLNPHAAAHPAALAPATVDGQRLDNVLKAMRKDVPQGVSQPVQSGQFQSGQNQTEQQ